MCGRISVENDSLSLAGIELWPSMTWPLAQAEFRIATSHPKQFYRAVPSPYRVPSFEIFLPKYNLFMLCLMPKLMTRVIYLFDLFS